MALIREELLGAVITVCSGAAKTCPRWLGQGVVAQGGLPDPAGATGSEEERFDIFWRVRDASRRKVLAHLRNVITC